MWCLSEWIHACILLNINHYIYRKKINDEFIMLLKYTNHSKDLSTILAQMNKIITHIIVNWHTFQRLSTILAQINEFTIFIVTYNIYHGENNVSRNVRDQALFIIVIYWHDILIRLFPMKNRVACCKLLWTIIQ